MDEECVQDRPTVFLSCTGRDKLSNIIEVLSQLRVEYIWIYISCVNQCAWTFLNRREELKIFRKRLMDELEHNIRRSNNTVLFLEYWNDTFATVDHIWVMWEIFVKVMCQTPISVLLQRFLNAIDSGDQNLLERVRINIASIDFERATADNNNDRAENFSSHEKDGPL